MEHWEIKFYKAYRNDEPVLQIWGIELAFLAKMSIKLPLPLPDIEKSNALNLNYLRK